MDLEFCLIKIWIVFGAREGGLTFTNGTSCVTVDNWLLILYRLFNYDHNKVNIFLLPQHLITKGFIRNPPFSHSPFYMPKTGSSPVIVARWDEQLQEQAPARWCTRGCIIHLMRYGPAGNSFVFPIVLMFIRRSRGPYIKCFVNTIWWVREHETRSNRNLVSLFS